MAGGSAPSPPKALRDTGFFKEAPFLVCLEVTVCTQTTWPRRHYNECDCPSLGSSERGEGPCVSSWMSSVIPSPDIQSPGICCGSDTEVCSQGKKRSKKQFLRSGVHTFKSQLQMLRRMLLSVISPWASVLIHTHTHTPSSAQKLIWHRCPGIANHLTCTQP